MNNLENYNVQEIITAEQILIDGGWEWLDDFIDGFIQGYKNAM